MNVVIITITTIITIVLMLDGILEAGSLLVLSHNSSL